MVQSPKYNRDTFITTALSYNPSNNITSGFLGYTYGRKTRDEDDVIYRLKECATLSMHPMLLPAVILKIWCNYYHDKLDNSRLMLRRVEEQNRRLEKKYSANQNSEAESDGTLEHADQEDGVPLEPADQEDDMPLENADQERDSQPENTDQEGKVIKSQYHENHETLDREYKFLWSENFHFVKNLSTSCLQAIAIIRSFKKQTRKGVICRILVEDGWIEREIKGHLLHLDGTVNAYEQRRERMLKRMEITFDEVC